MSLKSYIEKYRDYDSEALASLLQNNDPSHVMQVAGLLYLRAQAYEEIIKKHDLETEIKKAFEDAVHRYLQIESEEYAKEKERIEKIRVNPIETIYDWGVDHDHHCHDKYAKSLDEHEQFAKVSFNWTGS